MTKENKITTEQFFDAAGKAHECTDAKIISFRPAVYSIIKNKDNKVLMIKDERNGNWEFPGGGLEPCEDLSECAAREAKEETGFDIRVNEELPFYIHKDLAYSRKGEFFHGLGFFFIAELVTHEQGEQNFMEDENITAVEFLDITKLRKEQIAHFHQQAFEVYCKKYL